MEKITNGMEERENKSQAFIINGYKQDDKLSQEVINEKKIERREKGTALEWMDGIKC